MFREPFGNNRDRRCGPLIVLGKGAALPDWHAHSLEIIRRNDIDLRHWLLSCRHGTFLDVERETDVAAAKRNPPRRSG